MFRLGYNTNGLGHHRVLDALDLLAGLGYRGVALTPDAGLLDPYELACGEASEVRRRAAGLDLTLAVETGSRFLLDPKRKHFPTLLEPEASLRARRVDFLERCIDLAGELGAGVVSFWAGVAPGGGDVAEEDRERVWERLTEGVVRLLTHAEGRGVRLGFEPEPGMFIERPAGYLELVQRLGTRGRSLGLCLDVGHLLCTGDLPVDGVIRALGEHLVQVHLDDIHDGEHVHRMFGEGDLDLGAVLRALADVGYEGMAAVELSRDAHRGPAAAEEAMGHLLRALAPSPG